jgi:hypothetical protein
MAGGGGNEIYDSTQSCRLRCTRTRIKVSTFETSILAECECHAGCLQTATCCPDYASYCMLGQSHFVILYSDFFICSIVHLLTFNFMYFVLFNILFNT